MTGYIVRVELHGANQLQYDTLHTTMELYGFKRYITGTDASGQPGTWQLPTAEYEYHSEETAAAIRDQVKLIADSVKPGAWVLVTGVASQAWTTQKIKSG